MSKTPLVLLIGLVAALLLGTPATAQKQVKGKYNAIEVTRFDIQKDVEKFDAAWLMTLTEELVKQLQETNKFKQILREGEMPAEAGAPTLKLVGTIIKFKPGSRAARYMVGFGAGSTVVKAHIKIIDKSSGEVLFEDDVDGKVVMGVIGGESVGATRGLAKEVASKTKKQFF